MPKIHCKYCEEYQNSKWRVSDTDEEEDGKKKSKPKLRYCAVIQKYIKGGQEICPRFISFHLFWCNLYSCWRYVNTCIFRFNKHDDEGCNRCYQHKVICEVKKAAIFQERKQTIQDNKPKLIKRGVKC